MIGDRGHENAHQCDALVIAFRNPEMKNSAETRVAIA
jgi:hypothetical protein